MKRKINAILAICMFLTMLCACKKNGSEPNESQLTSEVTQQHKNLLAFKQNALSSTSSCYRQYLRDNWQALTSYSSVPWTSIATGLVSASLVNNVSLFMDCNVNIGPPGGGGGEEVPDDDSGEPYTDPGELDPAAIFTVLTQTYRYTSSGPATFWDAILTAYNTAKSQSVPFYTFNERMAAINKAIYDLDLDDIFINSGYHGELDNNIYYVIAGIQLLAGKTSITSNQYNTYIAGSSADYVQFPASHSAGWVSLKPSSSTTQLSAVADITIAVNYIAANASYYVNSTSFFNVGLGLDVSQFTPIYPSAGKLYTDNTHTSYIPNGYYRLPAEHPSSFERNNYIVHIQNGEIYTVYGE